MNGRPLSSSVLPPLIRPFVIRLSKKEVEVGFRPRGLAVRVRGQTLVEGSFFAGAPSLYLRHRLYAYVHLIAR